MRATDHIASINIPFEMALPSGERLHRSVNSHVVHGEQSCIIDAGVAGSADKLLGLVAEACGKDCKPKAVLLTHTHLDHIGSARTLREKFGIPVGCPAGETAWIEDVDRQARDRPVPGLKFLVEGSVPVDLRIEEGFEMDLGGVTVRAISTPGHSPASTCYEVVEENAIISGDVVPLLTEPPIYDDALASLGSVRRLTTISPKHLLPSWHEPLHGPEVGRHLSDGEGAMLGFHEAVARVMEAEPALDDERGCAKVLIALGFGSGAPNPLTLRTFRAHRRALADWPGR